MNRRSFTKKALSVGTLATLPASSSAVLGSNERVRLGFIGIGNRGDQLLDAFLSHKDAHAVAFCDVYDPYLPAANKKAGGKATLCKDFRKLVDSKDIDAVVIATPDHWHALQFVAACRAGKDVYVEKPLSLTIGEGQRMVSVAKETGRITQVGLHRRSCPSIHEAIQFLRSGGIGQISVAKCYHIRNESPMGIGNPPDSDPPEGLDWDMWLGPAKRFAYNKNRCLYKFRWFSDHSGGQLTNFGTHYLDIIQWALGKDAPLGVFAAGGKYVVQDNRDIPDTMEVIWEYEGGTLVTLSQFNANNAPANLRGWELEFRGTNGTLLMQDGNWEVFPERVRTRELPALSPIARAENAEQSRAVKVAMQPKSQRGSAETELHARNFLNSIKNRKPAHCPVETGHRSTSATLLAKISLMRKRYLAWDGQSERVTNDDESNQFLSYDYRKPWALA